MTQLIVNPPGLKRCARCKVTKPCDHYGKSQGRRDGLHPYCKACRSADNEGRREVVRAYNRARYLANRESILIAERERRLTDPEWRAQQVARSAEAYAKNRPERLAQQREYRQANPEMMRERSRAYSARVAADPERQRRKRAYRLAYARADYAADPERYREYQRQRRARKRAATVVEPTPVLLVAKWAYWGGLCWLCGGEAVEFDHVKPLAKGGAHCLANLRPACRSCNAQKSDTWPLAA